MLQNWYVALNENFASIQRPPKFVRIRLQSPIHTPWRTSFIMQIYVVKTNSTVASSQQIGLLVKKPFALHKIAWNKPQKRKCFQCALDLAMKWNKFESIRLQKRPMENLIWTSMYKKAAFICTQGIEHPKYRRRRHRLSYTHSWLLHIVKWLLVFVSCVYK